MEVMVITQLVHVYQPIFKYKWNSKNSFVHYMTAGPHLVGEKIEHINVEHYWELGTLGLSQGELILAEDKYRSPVKIKRDVSIFRLICQHNFFFDSGFVPFVTSEDPFW